MHPPPPCSIQCFPSWHVFWKRAGPRTAISQGRGVCDFGWTAPTEARVVPTKRRRRRARDDGQPGPPGRRRDAATPRTQGPRTFGHPHPRFWGQRAPKGSLTPASPAARGVYEPFPFVWPFGTGSGAVSGKKRLFLGPGRPRFGRAPSDLAPPPDVAQRPGEGPPRVYGMLTSAPHRRPSSERAALSGEQHRIGHCEAASSGGSASTGSLDGPCAGESCIGPAGAQRVQRAIIACITLPPPPPAPPRPRVLLVSPIVLWLLSGDWLGGLGGLLGALATCLGPRRFVWAMAYSKAIFSCRCSLHL